MSGKYLDNMKKSMIFRLVKESVDIFYEMYMNVLQTKLHGTYIFDG